MYFGQVELPEVHVLSSLSGEGRPKPGLSAYIKDSL